MGGKFAVSLLCNRLSVHFTGVLIHAHCAVQDFTKHHYMGGVHSSKKLERDVHELRKETVQLFARQQLLVVGSIGVGKSSFINTVNHVFNLVCPKSAYHEISEISGREFNHGALLFCAYGPENGMYEKLKDSEFSRERDRAPIFFDVAGVNDKIVGNIDFKQLLIDLVNGQVKEYTEMVKYCNSRKQLEELSTQPKVDSVLKAWVILCVVSICDPFPKNLLEQVNLAVNELKANQSGKNDVLLCVLVLIFLKFSLLLTFLR